MPAGHTLLVWGLFTRTLGVVFAIHFVSSLVQIRQLVGPRGLEPVGLLLRAVRRDLGVARGVWRFPTLAWLSSGDTWLLTIHGIGIVAALGIVTGAMPEHTYVLFGIVWLCWLSIQTTDTNLFSFPWDNLVLEAALYGAMLPSLAPLPSLRALSAPSPWLELGVNVLLFRVMFGMGLAKFKTPDNRTRNLTFLYHFLEWQPMPTLLAFRLHHLPMTVHKVALVGMFFVEMVAPFLIFGPHPLRLIAACLFLSLQIAIWLVGSYGTFNLMTMALALPLFASSFQVPPAPSSVMDWLILAHIALSLPYVLFVTSWNGTLWLFAPDQNRVLSRWLAPLLPLYRALAPFRFFNSYGVFVPRADDPRRITVLQWTRDGEVWNDYEPRYLTARTDQPPRRIAPHHPRLDHYLYYFQFSKLSKKLCCLMGTNPYYLHDFCLTEKLVQKLLRNDAVARSFFASGPPQAEPPLAVRYSAWHYSFTSRTELAASGQYYKRELVGCSAPIRSEAIHPDTGIQGAWAPFIFDSVRVQRGSLSFLDAAGSASRPLQRHALEDRDDRRALLDRLFGNDAQRQ